MITALNCNALILNKVFRLVGITAKIRELFDFISFKFQKHF